MKNIPEIEGLRGVAVLLVILFHAQISSFSGGFVGVDVFFTISGYLIAGLLVREWHQHQTISLSRFFARRILRLAPALMVTTVITAAIFSFVLPPALAENLTSELLSTQASVSNFWFFLHTNYFSDNFSSPALHTWSLAVEEQFYLVFPVSLLLLARYRATTWWRPAFTGAAALSLAGAAWAVTVAPQQAFFFPWFRAWEFLTGSLLALHPTSIKIVRYPQALTGTGLLLILGSSLYYTEATPFPGLSAIAPVLGTALVIFSAGATGLGNRLICMSPLRWVGKVSYSAYLVHWPIVCLLGTSVSLHPRPVRFGAVALSLALGWACWKWVETPFRAQSNRWTHAWVIRSFLGLNVLLCGVILWFSASGNWLWSHFPEASQLSQHTKIDWTLYRSGTCFLDGNTAEGWKKLDQATCLTPSSSKKNVLLMGDSHGANLWPSLTALNPGHHFMQTTAVGCRPVLDATIGSQTCLALNDHIFHDWLPQAGEAVSLVILAGRWEPHELPFVEQTARYLEGLGKDVLVVGPTPEHFVIVPLMLAYENILDVQLESKLLKKDRLKLDEAMAERFVDPVSKVHYFSMVNQLCATKDSHPTCQTSTDGTPIWSDRNHFTALGAMRVLQSLELP